MKDVAEKKADPETQVTTHSSELDTAISTCSIPDGEVAKLHADLGALSAQLIMDAVRVDDRKISATTADAPQLQFTDRIVDVPGVLQQRQVPTVQTVQKSVEVPQVQFLHKVEDMPVVVQRQVPLVQTVRRAAALTAELAAQSEKKVAVVCDHPPGLRDEPAEHITTPSGRK